MLYYVLGSPVVHSLSPQIHQAFAKQLGIQLTYEKKEVKRGELKSTLQTLTKQRMQGANITLPLKEEAYRLVNEHSDHAKIAQAVNTIKCLPDGGYWGDNTDGVGFIQDLKSNVGISLTDQRILILGAGGATRGILAPILHENPQLVFIANRTRPKAFALAEEFKPYGKIRAGGFSDLSRRFFNIIIHATALGHQGERIDFPNDFSPKGAFCYDLSYGKTARPFLDWAQENDATQCRDGLGMLVEQAAFAFQCWHDRYPDTRPIIHVLAANT